MNLQPVRVERRTAEIYLALWELPETVRPCRIRRRPGSALLMIDPRSTREEIIRWNADHLTDDEANALRAGFGQPPRGRYLDESLMIGPCLLFVPETLRLPGDPPFQGGAELKRREAAGELHCERAMYRAEINARELRQGA